MTLREEAGSPCLAKWRPFGGAAGPERTRGAQGRRGITYAGD